MINILGKMYMTGKEAAGRYAHSESWFEKRRHDRKPPHYVKIEKKIFYPLEETDKYFEDMLKVIF